MRSLLYALILISCAVSFHAQTQAAEMRDSITQHGVTWTFDKAYPTGQFITGDYWVIGPVTVVDITPKPGSVDKDTYKTKKNVWGDAILKPNPEMRNGSMIVETFTKKQGFDSRMFHTFDKKLSLSLPISLAANRSLISTVSHDQPGGMNLAHPIMWKSEKKVKTALKSAAVLTCLSQEPAADAFRPAHTGTTKTIYRESQIKWDLLQNLEAPESKRNWKELGRYFERPWIDFQASWTLQGTGPSENNPIYGREISRLTGLVALALHTNASKEEKRKALIGLIQYGIDVHGVIETGGSWLADGGHYSGRKLPLIFAGLLLGEEKMSNPGLDVYFQEDQDSYYADTWFGAPVSWQMVTHHGPKRAYEHIEPKNWTKYDKRSEGYRLCCNGKAWIATALTMRLIPGGMKAWNHDAFFDYCDRWMMVDEPWAAGRGDVKRPKGETSAYDGFVTDMWRKYRMSTNDEELSGHSRRWVWTMENGKAKAPGKWVANTRPENYPEYK